MLYKFLLAALVVATSGWTVPMSAPPASLVSIPLGQAAAPRAEVSMGRGDKRTTKGKRKAKSFGVSRPRNAELRKRKLEKTED